MTNHGIAVSLRHLVIEGSSQWALRQNATRKRDLSHINEHSLIVSLSPKESTSMVDYNRHSYVPLSRFFPSHQEVTGNACVQTVMATKGPDPTLPDYNVWFTSWKDVRRSVDRVHCHVSGHATFSVIKMLLCRTNLWNNQVQHY